MAGDQSIQDSIYAKLVLSGERERLRDDLKLKLIECGWVKQVKENCKELIKKRGVNNISVEEMVEDLEPKCQALVPNQIKKELLESIKLFLSKQKI